MSNDQRQEPIYDPSVQNFQREAMPDPCLLYTSDAADE